MEKELFKLEHNKQVTCVAFHEDLIITSSWDKTTRVWRKKTGEKLQSLAHDGFCENFDISPDGKFIAVAHNGVSIWSLETYEKIAEFKLGFAVDVRFQTNKKLVVALKNGHVHLVTCTHCL